MNGIRRAVAFLLLAPGALGTGCGGDVPTPEATTDVGTPPDAFVSVNGVRLQVVDWGGTGPALVLVHGAGDSPHIFDGIAAELREDFRVVAYGRRGHGRSDAPDGPYDQATLTEDLRQLLDSLAIAEAHLLGWSMGGNEITDFAARYPERTLGLVYLEAAYDWSDPAFLGAFGALEIGFDPDSADLASLDAYRGWYRRMWTPDVAWTPALEAHLSDIVRVAPDGSVASVPSPGVMAALWESLAGSQRTYTEVRAPALALYSTTFFAPALDDPEQVRAMAAWERDHMTPFREASMQRVRTELPGAVIEEIPNTTHVSIGFEPSLATRIRTFLLGST